MGIREGLLIPVALLICAAALVRPRFGLYGYIWFALLRPDVLAWSYGERPYSLAIAVCLLVGSLAHLPSIGRVFRSPISVGLQILVVIITFSAFAAVVPALAIPELNLYLRIIVVALLIPLLVTTADHVRELLVVMAVSLGLLGAKYGLFAVIHGGVTFAHGYGGFMSDNNAMALAFAMSVPLCWHLYSAYKPPLYSVGMALMAALTVVAILMTHSRGASLALAPALLLMVWRSKHRVVAAAVIGGAAVIGSLLVSAAFFSRWEFATSGELDASARSRVEQIQGAVKMWTDYPLLGVGFGTKNWLAMSSQYMGRENTHVVHNSYIQMLVDSGIFAFVLFVGLIAFTILWLHSAARRAGESNPSLRDSAYAIQTSLIVYAVGSMTLGRIEFDLFYFLLMAAASLQLVMQESQPAEAPATEDGGLVTVRPAAGLASARSRAWLPGIRRRQEANPGFATAARARIGAARRSGG